MKLSRREVLVAVPAAAALALVARPPVRSTINVRDHGAVGNGIADDSAALRSAVAAVKSGSILFFPKGSYRFAQQHPPGNAAIVIDGISNVDIVFEPGAELVMDNLDPANRTGTGHGIFIRGPAKRIALRNIKIRWDKPTSRRSFGDGIRVMGYPSLVGAPTGWSGPVAPVSSLTITDCQIESSPQAGVILIGVSDIEIERLHVQDSQADGLHFNACRQAAVDGFTSVNAGDDGIALVTYYAEVFSYDSNSQEFAFPVLTDWSNADFTITNVTVLGGRANGARLAGANRVTMRGLVVTGMRRGAGVIVDSSAPGADTAWNYVAPRGVHISNMVFDNCEMGIQLLARPNSDGDARFADFDVVATEATIRNCDNWSVRAESLTRQKISGLRVDNCTFESTSTSGGNGGFGLGNTRNMDIGKISGRHAKPVIIVSTVNATEFLAERFELEITGADELPPGGAPCAQFEASDGVITEMDISWLKAPPTWGPVRIIFAGGCGAIPSLRTVGVRTLNVHPPVQDPIVGC